MTAPPTRSFGYALGLVGATVVKYWRTCLLISSVYAVLSGITNALSRSSTGIVDPTTLSPDEVLTAGFALIAVLAASLLINVFVAPVTLGALSLLGSAVVYEDKIEREGIVRRAFDRALDVIGATLIITLILAVPPIVVGIFAFLVGVALGPSAAVAVLIFGSVLLGIPVLYAIVRLSLTIPVVMREGRGPIDALRRSWDLVGGAWWWVFGVTVFTVVAIAVAVLVLSYLSFIGRDTRAEFFLGALYTALATAIGVTLYGVASGVVYAMRAPEDLPGETASGDGGSTDISSVNAPGDAPGPEEPVIEPPPPVEAPPVEPPPPPAPPPPPYP